MSNESVVIHLDIRGRSPTTITVKNNDVLHVDEGRGLWYRSEAKEEKVTTTLYTIMAPDKYEESSGEQ